MEQRVLIDYLTISFKFPFSAFGYSLFRLFGEPQINSLTGKLEVPGWEPATGNPGIPADEFICGVYHQGVKLWFGHNICILDCSGKGCRTLENEFDWNWEAFFGAIEHDVTTLPTPTSSPLVHVSRLDVTCDLLNSAEITMEKLFTYVDDGRFVCKAKRYLIGNGNNEQWLYFGSPSSDRRLRIYNKALQMGLTEPWLRFEMQLRNECALSFLLNFYRNRNVPEIYYGILHDFLKFTKNVRTGTIMTA